ncbi:MAG: hypothetical protein WKH64_19455 [Chloroflexia bacterium]
MAITRLMNFRTVFVLTLALLMGSAAYGFAASNVVPGAGVGDGANTLSGYTVSSTAYNLNATNPQNIDSVTFSLTPSAGAGKPTTVKIKLVAAGSSYYSCTTPAASVSPYPYTCASTSPQATSANADELRVIAVE